MLLSRPPRMLEPADLQDMGSGRNLKYPNSQTRAFFALLVLSVQVGVLLGRSTCVDGAVHRTTYPRPQFRAMI